MPPFRSRNNRPHRPRARVPRAPLGVERLEDRCLLSAAGPQLPASYGRLPMSFEVNQGQAEPQVRFLSRGSGYSLFLTADEAVLSLQRPPASAGAADEGQAATAVLRMHVVGANAAPEVAGLGELAGKSNYLIGSDPARWHTDVPNFARVAYRDVYDGIDLVYHGSQQQLEYDFAVAPGADPAAIAVAFEGADRVELDAAGDLVLHTAGGDVRQHRPFAYQESGGVRQEVASHFVLREGSQVGFALGAYDAALPLVIDPVLVYSTYLGGELTDAGLAIAVDAAGNAYVTGITNSTHFPTAGPVQPEFASGFSDAFVAKLTADGTALVYATYLGGSGTDLPAGIAVDAAGNAYVSGGTTSSDFPTARALQPGSGGGQDAFVVKLSPAGSQLVYATYLGGGGDDEGRAIAVDAAGNAYVTGEAAPDFPTAQAFEPTLEAGRRAAFVTKLAADGSAFVYSTYLGVKSGASGHGIAVDPAGNAYVTGTTGAGFPTVNAFQPNPDAGAGDAFVAKLAADGSGLVYATYLGGSGSDYGNGIAVDPAGNAYVTGETRSPDFPQAGGFESHLRGVADVFVAKFRPDGAVDNGAYVTYFGGDGNDGGAAIAVDAFGNAYVTGETSGEFPIVDAVQSDPGVGSAGGDAFVAKLGPVGNTLVYSTYLGGGGWDLGAGIAVDTFGNAYVTGRTESADFPTANPLQPSPGGGVGDAFVAKIADAGSPNQAPTTTGLPPLDLDLGTTQADLGLRDHFQDAEDGADGLTYTVRANSNPGLFSAVTVDAVNDQLVLAFPPGARGTADLAVRATDSGGKFVEATLTVRVRTPLRDLYGFDWIMPKHFGVDDLTSSYDPIMGRTTLHWGEGGLPAPDGLRDYRWQDPAFAPDYMLPETKATLKAFSTATESSDVAVSVRWEIDGKDVSTSGEFTHDFKDQGTYPVTLVVTAADGRTASITKDVVVRDIFIASVGDSFSSGQGNPDKAQEYNDLGFLAKPAVWEDERTHRSFVAGPAQAAWRQEDEDPHTSVTFVSLAASGATIVADPNDPNNPNTGGLLAPYRGPVWPTGDNNVLPPQIDELARLAKLADPDGRTIDTLVLTIGINDIRFAKVLEQLIKAFPGLGGPGPTITEPFEADLATLEDRYDQLDKRLRNIDLRAGQEPIHVKNVYIAEYPDPTREADGNVSNYNPLGDLLGFLSHDQMVWASNVVLPALNGKVRAAAVRHGWNYVGGMVDRFFGHGFGAGAGPEGRWFNTAKDAVLGQGSLTPETPGDAFWPFFPGTTSLNASYPAPVHRPTFDAAEAALLAAIPVGSLPAAALFFAFKNLQLVNAVYPAAAPAVALFASNLAAMKGTPGTIHPNGFGHQAFAGLITEQLRSASLRGHVFEDSNANGVKDPDEAQGLGHWTVYVDANQNGQQDPGEPHAQTDNTGAYSLTGLEPGTHRVRRIPANGGEWLPANPAFDVTLGRNLDVGAGILDLVAYRLGSLAGRVVFDLDRDGQADAWEPGLAGRTVYLDRNNNGAPDLGPPRVVPSTDPSQNIPDATAVLGDPEDEPGRTVSQLVVGDVTNPLVNIQVTVNFTHTRPGELDVSLTSPLGRTFELFPSTAGLAGTFLADFTPEELTGTWTLEILDTRHGHTGRLLGWSLTLSAGEPAAATDAEGNYSIGNLRPGEQVMRLVSRPDDGPLTTPLVGYHSFRLTSSRQATGLDFTIVRPNSVTLNGPAEGQKLTLDAPDGTRLTDVRAVPNPSPADFPSPLNTPVGFLAFKAGAVPVGGTVPVTLTLPPGTAVNTYYRYGPTPANPRPHWYPFLFDGSTGAVINGNVVTLFFVDGARGDDDLTANGVIVDAGAPAFEALRDLTGLAAVTRGKVRSLAGGRRFRQQLTLRNVSGAALRGPFFLTLEGLGRKVRLLRQSGTTRTGQPYLRLDPATLAAGQQLTVTLKFSSPRKARPRFTLHLWAGLENL